jgi:hypothetical protein
MVTMILTCAMALAQDEPAGVIIEMEDYEVRVPDDGSFAEVTSEAFASRRRVLFKFYPEGYVVYRFTAEQAGTYSGWMRYGAQNVAALRVDVDPGDEPDFATVELPVTGGYVGEGVWGWARIFQEELAAGEHTVAIGSAAFRPDCLYITPGDEEPTDEIIRIDWASLLGAETMELLGKPYGEVRPDWLDGAADYELPAWYDEYRVQLHTRLGPPWMDKPIFLTAAEAFRSMGVHTFVRHIKSGGEGAWWPSAVGAILPGCEERNLAQEIIDNAHANGCRIIAYSRHMEDHQLFLDHPEWAARDDRGQPLQARREKMCFNSPYDDFVLTRLLELVDMGVDGLYFDEVHMPKQGCWCEWCKRKFTEQTGLDHPESYDPGSPLWHRLADFNNATIERVFLKWRAAIHERNPECVMLIGSNTWPTMADRHMTNRLFRIADSMKTEFTLPIRVRGRMLQPGAGATPFDPEVKVALGYTLARDAADGRPAHIWTFNLQDETSALYAAAGMMTHGCIANIDVREDTIPNMTYKPAFELGDRVSPYFHRTKPLRWAAVHYSEFAKDKYELDGPACWRRVLFPVYGAYLALFRAHLPVGIITDSQLEEGLLDGYRVLFVPAPDDLTDSMRQVVEDFEAGGGVVIRQREDWLWHDLEGLDAAAEAFIGALGDEPGEAPVQASGGPVNMHVDSFLSPDGNRLTVSLANEFTWLHTGRNPPAPEDLPKPPPDCEGVSAEIRGRGVPARVFDAVTGNELEFEAIAGGVRVALPTFSYMAVVVAEF